MHSHSWHMQQVFTNNFHFLMTVILFPHSPPHTLITSNSTQVCTHTHPHIRYRSMLNNFDFHMIFKRKLPMKAVEVVEENHQVNN